MTGYRSHYEILKIPADASLDEVKHAFRTLSKIHHPDKSDAPGSGAYYTLILGAYQVLSSEKTRAEYDRFLKKSTFLETQRKIRPLRIHSEKELFAGILPGMINMTLWELEELVSRRETAANPYILEILTFLDKWILTPRGYKDYYAESRRLPSLDPRLLVRLLGGPRTDEFRLPYTGVEDYFYALRKRANSFISDLDFREGSGTGLDGDLFRDGKEFHNLAVHYLSYLLDDRPVNPVEIPGYAYSDTRYTL